MCSEPTRCVAAALLLVAAVSGTAHAQQPARSFEQLPLVVKLGDTVTVIETAGRQTKGTLVDVTPSTVVLLDDGVRHNFQQDQVTAIRQRRRDSLRNGALWGLGTGAVLGLYLAAVGAAADGGYADQATALVPVLITGGLGSAIGVGVDAMIEGQHVIYERTTTTGANDPRSDLLGRDRRSVLLTLRF